MPSYNMPAIGHAKGYLLKLRGVVSAKHVETKWNQQVFLIETVPVPDDWGGRNPEDYRATWLVNVMRQAGTDRLYVGEGARRVTPTEALAYARKNPKKRRKKRKKTPTQPKRRSVEAEMMIKRRLGTGGSGAMGPSLKSRKGERRKAKQKLQSEEGLDNPSESEREELRHFLNMKIAAVKKMKGPDDMPKGNRHTDHAYHRDELFELPTVRFPDAWRTMRKGWAVHRGEEVTKEVDRLYRNWFQHNWKDDDHPRRFGTTRHWRMKQAMLKKVEERIPERESFKRWKAEYIRRLKASFPKNNPLLEKVKFVEWGSPGDSTPWITMKVPRNEGKWISKVWRRDDLRIGYSFSDYRDRGSVHPWKFDALKRKGTVPEGTTALFRAFIQLGSMKYVGGLSLDNQPPVTGSITVAAALFPVLFKTPIGIRKVPRWGKVRVEVWPSQGPLSDVKRGPNWMKGKTWARRQAYSPSGTYDLEGVFATPDDILDVVERDYIFSPIEYLARSRGKK